MTNRRRDTTRRFTRVGTDEADLYYRMVWRGLPSGLIAYAILLLPPYPELRWLPIILGTAVFLALAVTIVIGSRAASRRPTLARELIAQNVLANTATALGIWAAGPDQGSVIPLLFVIILYNSCFRGGWLMAMAWANGTAAHLIGSLLGGDERWTAITSTVVFAAAAAAAQLSVAFVVRRLRRLAADVGLEREIAGYAARPIDRDEAFRLMLVRSAELLRVARFAVVSTKGGEHQVVTSIRNGVPGQVYLAELDLGGSARIGSVNDEEHLRLCTGLGERPDPAAMAAVRDLFMLVVERARHMSGLYTLAHSDGLTGLANRRYLDMTFGDLIREGTEFAIVILDLDHFKELNDTQGHLAGDDVLIRVARLLRAVARAGDVTARYGGEEFCVLIPHATADDAAAFEARLREQWRAVGLPVDFSAGIAASRAGDAVGDVLHRADRALYEAKAGGRGRAVRAA